MAERTYAGVYTESKKGGPGPVRGVTTSNMGLVGFTTKGKTNTPILCTDFSEFEGKFGTFTSKSLTPHMAYAFSQNGGRRAYVVRVVAEDALKSAWALVADGVTPENITNVAQPSGQYNLSLDNAPVVPGSLTELTFQNGTADDVNVFKDDGTGVLVKDDDKSGSNAAGGSESIDYETGEITVQLTDPTQFGGGLDDILALYSHKVFTFRMAWEGAAGDHYRVRIVGAPDYEVAEEARFTRFNLLVDYDVNEDATARQWTTVEQFDDLVFDNASDPAFVASVINDKKSGSEVIEVVDYGNGAAPAELAGTLVADENLATTRTPAYDGANKAFKFESVSKIAPKTFSGEFTFTEDQLQIGVGDGTAVPALAWTPAALKPTTVVIDCFLNDGPAQIVDNGGNLELGGTGVGTIDQETGEIVIDLTPATKTFEAGIPVKLTCEYLHPVVVVDDANGNLQIGEMNANAPAKFLLHPNGTNSVGYDNKAIEITWKIDGNPVAGPAGAAKEELDYYTQPEAELVDLLTGGSDGSPVSSDDIISPLLAGKGHGMYALSKADEMMTVVVADFQTDEIVSRAVIDYCEIMKDKFAPLTVPHGLEPQEAVNWKKFELNKRSSYAALYYNHVTIIDPITKAATDIPLGGHIAGIYARTDANRNVAKTPSGAKDGALRWAEGLEHDLERRHAGIVFPQQINPIVGWPQTGRAVWGGRTMEVPGGEYDQVAVRRLFMMLEKSIFNATHIHVFENNGPALWATIRAQVTAYMRTLHDSNHFAGETAADSFFVICDDSNNTKETRDLGLVFCDVGAAPHRPGEYIVFRFQQKSLA